MVVGLHLRPENALKRAEDFLKVDKRKEALDALHDLMKARGTGGRNRQMQQTTWNLTHEKIIMKEVELCVELRKAEIAKDALFQYRNLTQQNNPSSLKAAILHYLDSAEARIKKAQQESHELVEDIGDDLEQAVSPENLLLSAVSSADTQDRADRAVLMPWLRFLWDSYRHCLEMLRNNQAGEELYHSVARRAFDFCQKYQRRTEFRKLCEVLRTHLNTIQRQQHYQYSVKLSNPETLANMQETRLAQLEVAIAMELWQEAFKSSDDVWQILNLSREKDRRTVKTQTYVNFYEKLALVFWQSDNQLFHAAALTKLYAMYKDMRKNFTSDEAQSMATRCILAVLSIPSGADAASDLARHLDMEDQHSGNQLKLAQLLDLKAVPSRKSLLRDVGRLAIVDMGNQGAKQLYELLENEFAPLQLAQKIESELSVLEKCEKADHVQYVGSLRNAAAMRILRQISQVYETIKIDRLSAMIPFLEREPLERFIAFAGKKGFVQVHVDHREQCYVFASGTDSAIGCDERQEADGTPIDKLLPSDEIRNYLRDLYGALRDANESIESGARQQALQAELDRLRKLSQYSAESDYKHLIERRKRIEQYKEIREKERNDQRHSEQQIQQQRDEQRRREEQYRLAEERRLYEEQKKNEEKLALERRIRRDRVDNLQKSQIGKVILKDYTEEDLEKLDTDELVAKQKEKMDRDRNDALQKQRMQEKKFDYYVRACHELELPYRQDNVKAWRELDEQEWVQFEQRRVQQAVQAHEHHVQTYERLQRVKNDATHFLKSIAQTHKEATQERHVAWQKKLDEEREKKLIKIKATRLAQMKAEWKKAQDDQKEEDIRKKKSEADAKRYADRGGRPGGGDSRGPPEDSRAEASGNWRKEPRSQQDAPPMRSGNTGPPPGHMPVPVAAAAHTRPDRDEPMAWRQPQTQQPAAPRPGPPVVHAPTEPHHEPPTERPRLKLTQRTAPLPERDVAPAPAAVRPVPVHTQHPMADRAPQDNQPPPQQQQNRWASGDTDKSSWRQPQSQQQPIRRDFGRADMGQRQGQTAPMQANRQAPRDAGAENQNSWRRGQPQQQPQTQPAQNRPTNDRWR